jgi:NADH-quinone oxidoreductase subunit G
MATLYIDNRQYEFEEGQNLLHTCIGLGLDLPYFCWHPALHSVGACRQCAVRLFRNEADTLGMIVMSCMTPAKNGMRISIDDPEARRMRAGVIEFLMANHPHDCPVCDEGGECHLQDMTVMTGHTYRTHRFKKRTHRNQDLGPFVNHEMNRCIACYRCVRFYRDLAGGRDLGVFGSHDSVYFGRQTDGPLESELSGNLIEICPTGVFTDKTFKKHFTRKWDLESAPSVCAHCGLGCNIFAEQRSGTLRRIRNRYNHEVNGYFICDRGRFGYEFVNSPLRVRTPRTRASASVERLDKNTALARAADVLRSSKGVIGIGSPRASLESNFALKTFVGAGRFFQGVSSARKQAVDEAVGVLKQCPVRCASLRDVREADAVFVIGEDVAATAPMLAYAIRQSVGQRMFDLAASLSIDAWNDYGVRGAFGRERNPLFIVSASASGLDPIATQVFRAAPDDCARLGFAVAHLLDGRSPDAGDLNPDVEKMARRIALSLRESKRPAIISGAGYASLSIVRAAANVARALGPAKPGTMIHLVMPECNSCGLSCLGGGDLAGATEMLLSGKADTLLIVENDIFRRMATRDARVLLDKAKHVLAVDHLDTATTAAADIVFPAATFAESSGTFISGEGRAQRFFKAIAPEGAIQESWRWLRDIMIAAGQSGALPWNGLDDILETIAESDPLLSGVRDAAPYSDFRLSGQKIARQSPRSSGRNAHPPAQTKTLTVPAEDPDSPLSFSMEGPNVPPPASLNPRYWAPGWNSAQALGKYQEQPGGALAGGDPGARLFAHSKNATADFFKELPKAFSPRAGAVLAVPLHHVFGSEELSFFSPAIAQASPKPYLALCPADALHLDVNEGEIVEITGGSASYKFSAALHPGLPRGIAGMPESLPETRGIVLPQWFLIKKDTAHD